MVPLLLHLGSFAQFLFTFPVTLCELPNTSEFGFVPTLAVFFLQLTCYYMSCRRLFRPLPIYFFPREMYFHNCTFVVPGTVLTRPSLVIPQFYRLCFPSRTYPWMAFLLCIISYYFLFFLPFKIGYQTLVPNTLLSVHPLVQLQPAVGRRTPLTSHSPP